MTIRTRARVGWLCVGLALGLGLVGCGKKSQDTPTGSPPGGATPMPGGPGPDDTAAKLPGGPEFAAAKTVYAANGCANCHKLGDTGGGGGGPPGGKGGWMGQKGPDLTHVGAKAENTADRLGAFIRDPKAQKPKGRMPAFGPDKISDADLTLLAEFLAAQK